MRAWITRDPIDTAAVLHGLASAEDGAALLFVGVVRRQNEGRAVTALGYEAFEPMAEAVLGTIVAEAAALARSDRIACVHRVGELAIGEVSVAIAVAAPHRAQAYDASRYIIEEIKKRLPVWKQEHYVDGNTRWLGGAA